MLHDWHQAAQARFCSFAGYEMPLQYPAGAIEEHRLTRRSAGLFDIDHMGQLRISGDGATEALSKAVTNKIVDMKPGQARYALLLNDKGGVIDDIFIYKLFSEHDDSWLVVVNAANRTRDREHLESLFPSSVSIQDISDETYMISVQGPEAVALINYCTKEPILELSRNTMVRTEILQVPVYIARTGYTGEDGVEMFFPASNALSLWELILDTAKQQGIEAGPVGLAARDSLRFEAGFPLYGHELSESITPLEALVSWACDFQKDFVGKQALLQQKEQGLSKKLVTLTVQGGVPREGYEVCTPGGQKIGHCVSGMFCPTLQVFAANAFVPPAFSKAGTELVILIHEKAKPAVVSRRPLYIPAYRRDS